MRRQIGLKLPVGLIEELDGRAGELGLSRTAVIERACEGFLAGDGQVRTVAFGPVEVSDDRPAAPAGVGGPLVGRPSLESAVERARRVLGSAESKVGVRPFPKEGTGR